MAEVKYSLVSEIPELAVSSVNSGHIALEYRRQLVNMKPRTAKTKRIGELAYSSRKLFRQKGTGFARQGERGNPHMRGGAVPMGPLPVRRELKINKKVRRSAFHSAVKFHLDNHSIKVIKGTEFEGVVKTRDVYSALVKSGFSGRGIVVVTETAPVERALRNIAGIHTLHPNRLTVYHLVNSNFLIFTEPAFESFRDFLKSTSVIRHAKPVSVEVEDPVSEVRRVRLSLSKVSKGRRKEADEDE